MQNTQQLAGILKQLRMPGIAANLDIRLKEVKEAQLGHLDFLHLLLQDEVINREANLLSKKLKTGGFSSRMTFESFDFRFNEETLNPQTIRDLATCHFVERNQSLVLCGPPGIGKSHISQALGHEVCRRGGDAYFVKTQQLLEELSNDQYPRRVTRLWKRIKNVDLLILDDFGFRRYDNAEAEMLYTLSDSRLGNKSTVITSNRPTQDWFGVFPDPVIGGAILDRLVSGAIKIIVEKAKSYRKLVTEIFPAS